MEDPQLNDPGSDPVATDVRKHIPDSPQTSLSPHWSQDRTHWVPLGKSSLFGSPRLQGLKDGWRVGEEAGSSLVLALSPVKN